MQAKPYKIPSQNKTPLDYILKMAEGALTGYTQATQAKKAMEFEREKSINLPTLLLEKQLASTETMQAEARKLEQNRIKIAQGQLDLEIETAANNFMLANQKLKLDKTNMDWQKFIEKWKMNLAESGFEFDKEKFRESVKQWGYDYGLQTRLADIREKDINYQNAYNTTMAQIARIGAGQRAEEIDLKRLDLAANVAIAMEKFASDPEMSANAMLGMSDAVGLSQNPTIKLYNETMQDLAQLMSKKGRLTDDEKARATVLISTMQNISPKASSIWESHIGSPLPKPVFVDDSIYDNNGYILDNVDWKGAIKWDYGPSGFPQIPPQNRVGAGTSGRLGSLLDTILGTTTTQTGGSRFLYRTEGTTVNTQTLPKKTTVTPPQELPIKINFPENVKKLVDAANKSTNPEAYLRGLMSRKQSPNSDVTVSLEEIQEAYKQIKKK